MTFANVGTLGSEPGRRDELIAILYQCLEAVRISSLLLWPIIPQRMEDLWKAIGERAAPGEATIATRSAFGLTAPGTRIEKVALYPRLERMGS